MVADTEIVSRFHLADGWFFCRLSDAGVMIQKRQAAHVNAPVTVEAIIGPASWASIISSVSHEGGTSESHQKALVFHNGEPKPKPKEERVAKQPMSGVGGWTPRDKAKKKA